MENTRHDLGSDLFVQVRDQRLFDLGLVIGVQVKTGSSYFSAPSTAPDVPGWWYYDEDKQHTDAWVSHGLPHLLVLHDLDVNQSWWVHVTREAVKDTGSGAKILVPQANTLDGEHLDELLAVAGSGRPGVHFEGSAWRGASPPASADRLRFALLVPRLVAPHPNAGRQDELTPAQALALLMQARFHELRRYAEEVEGVPTLTEAHANELWAWRLFGAVAARILHGDLQPLREVVEGAGDVAGHCAASVLLAGALIERAAPAAALEVIDLALEKGEAAPVDHAWLRLQRSRALTEQGQLDEARVDASEVQRIRSTTAHDVTATAITGVAATVLFNTADPGKHDLAQAIEGSDTIAAWWRTQTTTRGVTAIVERIYTEWARDRSVVFAASDEANNQLFVAALTASALGDQATWRHLRSLLGKDTLLRLGRHSDVADAAGGLDDLRRAGAVKAVSLAVGRLSDDGPALAVRRAGAAIDLEASTRTTVLADLALLAHGGDLLEPVVATAAARWLVARIDDPEPFENLSTTRYGSVEAEVLENLAGLMTVVPDVGVEVVRQRISRVQETRESIRSAAWKKLLASIPPAAWAGEQALSVDIPPATADLHKSILGLRAPFDPEAREQLQAQAGRGSLRALANFGDVADLDGDAATLLMADLRRRLTQQRGEAERGQLSFGGFDLAQALATVVTFHPDQETEDSLLGYLEDGTIPRASKGKALGTLADNRALLTSALRERLPAAAQRAAAGRSSLDGAPTGVADIDGEAGFLVAVSAMTPEASPLASPLCTPGRHHTGSGPRAWPEPRRRSWPARCRRWSRMRTRGYAGPSPLSWPAW